MVLLVASYPYVGCSSYGHSATQRHSMRIRMWDAFLFLFFARFCEYPNLNNILKNFDSKYILSD